MSYFPLIIFHTISCPLYNSKIVRVISMKLGTLIMGIHGLTVIPFILSGHSFYNSLNIQLFTFYHNSKHFRVCDQDNRTLAILRRLFWKLEIIKRLWI